jgi:cytochrome c
MDRLLFVAFAAVLVSLPAGAQQDSGAHGEQNFRVCAACHSLEPDRNLTGPSLANLWGRKAGSFPSFDRYSDALKASGIIWDDRSLDAWLTDPARMVPDNEMPFDGIKDSRVRADLLAFLKEATKPGTALERTAENRMNRMGGMMGGRAPNLKNPDPAQHVTGITHCRDTYRVTTADGKTRHFWERNLRLKTDSSQDGPQSGAPALLPAGMMGDRADVIFAEPAEISKMIAARC